MKRLSLTLSRKQLLTIYKTFVRSHLEYADMIYDKPFNNAFKEKGSLLCSTYYYWSNKKYFCGTFVQITWY